MYSEKSRQNINGKQKGFFLQIAFVSLFVCLFVCFLPLCISFQIILVPSFHFYQQLQICMDLLLKLFFSICNRTNFYHIWKKNLSKMNIVTSIYFFCLDRKHQRKPFCSLQVRKNMRQQQYVCGKLKLYLLENKNYLVFLFIKI